MCLAQGHNAVAPVRLEPAAPRSPVKHSTTEPLRSFHLVENLFLGAQKNLLIEKVFLNTQKQKFKLIHV